jgi:hypothetical protein
MRDILAKSKYYKDGSSADSLEACREELREVLEEWILLGIKMGQV